MPSSIKLEKETICKSLRTPFEKWQVLDERNKCTSVQVDYGDLKQRWIVIGSKDMEYRSMKSTDKMVKREQENLEKKLKKHSRKRFSCKSDAQESLQDLQKTSKLHLVKTTQIIEHKSYTEKGRPKSDAKFTISYQVNGEVLKDQIAIKERMKQGNISINEGRRTKQDGG